MARFHDRDDTKGSPCWNAGGGQGQGVAESAGDFAAEVKTLVFNLVQQNAKLGEQLHTKDLEIDIYRQSRQQKHQHQQLLSPRLSFITQFDLLRILDVDPMVASQDLVFALQQAHRMDSPSRGRAMWLMKTPQLQMWLGDTQRSLLLADGALPVERISPMSVLAGTLAVSLLELPPSDAAAPVVVLHFFCGQHLDPDADDGLTGTNGLLRSLITQLLLWFTPPLVLVTWLEQNQQLRISAGLSSAQLSGIMSSILPARGAAWERDEAVLLP